MEAKTEKDEMIHPAGYVCTDVLCVCVLFGVRST